MTGQPLSAGEVHSGETATSAGTRGSLLHAMGGMSYKYTHPCLHTHTHTHARTHAHTHMQTHTHRHIHTERERERQRKFCLNETPPCCCISNTLCWPSSVPFQSLSSFLLSGLKTALLSNHPGHAHKCKIRRMKKDPLHFDCDLLVNLPLHCAGQTVNILCITPIYIIVH